MSWSDRGTLKGSIDRDARIARRVMALLRAEGFKVRWIDARSAAGIRLMPANLLVCGQYVICRSAGYVLDPGSADDAFMREYGALLQLGASDVSSLLKQLKT